ADVGARAVDQHRPAGPRRDEIRPDVQRLNGGHTGPLHVVSMLPANRRHGDSSRGAPTPTHGRFEAGTTACPRRRRFEARAAPSPFGRQSGRRATADPDHDPSWRVVPPHPTTPAFGPANAHASRPSNRRLTAASVARTIDWRGSPDTSAEPTSCSMWPSPL